MTPPQARQLHANTPSRWTDCEWVRCSWRGWLTWGCLFLAVDCGIAGSAVQPASASKETPPPGVDGTPPPPEAPRLPRITPDYVGVVLPPNLAPLNLTIQEPGSEYRLGVSGSRGKPLELRQPDPHVRFPLREWKELLGSNRGGTLRWDIAVRSRSGEWISYTPFENQVAEEEIDSHILYRRLRPLYSSYRHLGVYQRNLETFEEKPVLRNATIEHGCVNCHSFHQGAPERFAISFRGRFGTPTVLVSSNRISRIDTKMGYLSWHPNGKLLVFSANSISQFFHLAGPDTREVYDPHSDLQVFHVEQRKVEKPPAIDAPDRNENWPYWAPDGRHLYYCSAPVLGLRDVPNLRYDLIRVSYDPDKNQWGEPETLISGAERRMSFHQPRPSPDGRYLALTVSACGSFPLFRSDSDLYLFRLDTRELERLPINSKRAETWPCWSSNGRWLVFGSRGLDGVFARLLISHVDSAARFSKPLLLPQEDPAYYDTCLDNFNVPELARGPVLVSEEQLARVVNPSGNRAGPPGREPPPPQVHDGDAIPDGSYR